MHFPIPFHKIYYKKFELNFYKPARTSRNTLETKTVFLIFIEDAKGNKGTGECSVIKGLSRDDCAPDFYAGKLEEVIQDLYAGRSPDLKDWPGISFALDTAFADLQNGGKKMIFDTPFYYGKTGIPINGLVWMNECNIMLHDALQKAAEGFDCIKFKIGAEDFDEECRMLEQFRKKVSASSCALRLDANGAFEPGDALEKLKELSRFEIHSIEQPVRSGQWEMMEKLCAEGKIPVALDEELIACDPFGNGYDLLAAVWPAYLVLKPSLLGGFTYCDEWIRLAERSGVKWWITSALESNIGLNAIAQYASRFNPSLPQGLGTGKLFSNNFVSPLESGNGTLKINLQKVWQEI